MQVMNVIVTLEEKAFLADVVRLSEPPNHQTMARCIIQVLKDLNLEFNQVQSVATDSASYNKKGWNEILAPLLEKAVHVPCLCHVLSLVGEEIVDNVSEDMTRFIFMWPGLFTKQPGRRKRYNDYMGQYLPKVSAVSAGNVTHSFHWTRLGSK